MKTLFLVLGICVCSTFSFIQTSFAETVATVPCVNKPCTAPPVELGGTSLADVYQKASEAFFRAQAPVDLTITGTWKATLLAPIDQNWNTPARLQASYNVAGVPSVAHPLMLSFGQFSSGGNDFLEVPPVVGFGVTFTSLVGTQGPHLVSYTADSACFATYQYKSGEVNKDAYYDHECRLLKSDRLLCALTFRSENPAKVLTADVGYLAHVIGYIGYTKQ
jgi:hypothetical protein